MRPRGWPAFLDQAERERWAAYRRDPDRDRFVVGCALAKTVIGACTGREPADISFDRTCRDCGRPHGKPVLRCGALEFSVAHSGDLVAVAVATAPVGVDVEQLADRPHELGGGDPAALARVVLAEPERQQLAAVDPPGRARAFLVAWARKEAVTKAKGDGMRVPFSEVVVAADAAAPRLEAWPYPEDPRGVSLFDLDAGPGYVAALAVLGRCHTTRARDGSALLERPRGGTRGLIASGELAGGIAEGSSFLSVCDSSFGGSHMSETLTLPVLPLDDEVVLPGMVVPLETSQPEISAAIDAARMPSRQVPGMRSEATARVLLVPRLPDRGLAGVGTLATVEQVGRLPGGQPGALVRGVSRVKIGSGTTGPGAALWVQGTTVDETGRGPRADELAQQYKTLVTSILQQRGLWQIIDVIQQITDASAVADNAGYASYLSTAQKLQVLETADLVERLELVIGWTREHLAELDVAESIRKDVQEGMDKQQKEFLLRQQLAAVRKELADLNGEAATEEDDYRARVEAADLPEAVRDAALKEVEKLERTPDASPETGWIRTWLDTVLDIPWNARTEDSYDIAARGGSWTRTTPGWTTSRSASSSTWPCASAARTVASGSSAGGAPGRCSPWSARPASARRRSASRWPGPWTVSSSGCPWAACGTRPRSAGTGAPTWGRCPAGSSAPSAKAGSMNPVVLLDEVDKIGADYRGDPASALLEVLDPAQNHTFRDHYLEVELDLSDVVFLATANVLDQIPGPLLDRMELVQLDGYTEDEKVLIGRDHLLPRQLSKAGLNADEVSVSEDALRLLAAEYTHEAGVRSLERSIARILRKVAARVALGDASLPVTVGPGELKGYLGRPRFTPETSLAAPDRRTAVPGVATGLAVTGAGGDVLFIEASLAGRETGETGVTLTGQLGDVMKESARIALSYLRSHGEELGPSGRRAEGPRRARACAGRRGAQGRPERGRDHDHSARVAAVRPAGPGRRGHDR